ncbi:MULTISPECIES: ribbon-helix-helix protein, CopG family [Burkholderia]|uniref:ribbon-helix-helix protein, CopG family n=1 Tax=Burkholderia TaxID=32008 RepID=UPI0005322DEE|nr:MULTISPECIES: ribbon-helix-helix protein, CopG family [Burkholderia]KGS04642.1 ribbon-helix-helix, copG family protein [Burkholderia sp. ABCPW 111]KWZ47744.1 CopG family transcriptional regulator [Burkholderia savannae]
METKSARLTVLIDPFKKKAFEQLCAAQDLTPSQVVRQMIRDYLEQHGVSYKTRSPVAPRGAAKPQPRRKNAA